jgi:serine/threonine protein kinase
MIINKYKIDKEIKRGAFGCILRGNYLKTGEPVAIKIEYGEIPSLKHEVKIINYLSTSGVKQIPSIYWYGIHENNPCLIITLYECSLFDYMKHRQITVEKMNILMLKTIDIIEHIHRFFVLHRDIKPANFMIKDGDIFLIDFGLSTFYLNENGEHYPNKQNNTIIGTPKFVSINIHMGHQYSRRDDLISLGYMYVYMILGDAIWFSDIYTPLNILNGTPEGVPLDVSRATLPINQLKSTVIKDDRSNSNVHRCKHNNMDDINKTSKKIIDIDHPMNVLLKHNKSYDVFSKYIQETTPKTQTQTQTQTHEQSPYEQINQYILYTYSLDYLDTPKYKPLKQIFI